MKNLGIKIFGTNIGRFLLSIIIMVIGGVMSPNGIIGENIYAYDEGMVWNIMFYIGITATVIQSAIWILFGLVINSWKNWYNSGH